jgi:MFS family permease
MIQGFHSVHESQIAYHAGMFIAIFTFCEFLSGMVWARVSDKIGRKMTLLLGCLCGIVTTLGFGLSRSIVMATSFRALGGLLNPNIGVVQTCTVELAERKEQQGKLMWWCRNTS